jgi:nitrile hydratase
VDDAFREALLGDANAAVVKHMGIGAGVSAYSTKLTAVENTADVHNVIVCTLCR